MLINVQASAALKIRVFWGRLCVPSGDLLRQLIKAQPLISVITCSTRKATNKRKGQIKLLGSWQIY